MKRKPSERNIAIAKHYKNTNNLSATALCFNVTRERVRQIVNQVNGAPVKRRTITAPKLVKKVRKLFTDLAPTDRQAGEILGISRSRVENIRATNKIPTKMPKITLCPSLTVTKMHQHMHTEGLTQRQIAVKYKLKLRTIQAFAQKLYRLGLLEKVWVRR